MDLKNTIYQYAYYRNAKNASTEYLILSESDFLELSDQLRIITKGPCTEFLWLTGDFYTRIILEQNLRDFKRSKRLFWATKNIYEDFYYPDQKMV